MSITWFKFWQTREKTERDAFYEKTQEQQAAVLVHDAEHLYYATKDCWLRNLQDKDLRAATDQAQRLYEWAWVHYDKNYERLA